MDGTIDWACEAFSVVPLLFLSINGRKRVGYQQSRIIEPKKRGILVPIIDGLYPRDDDYEKKSRTAGITEKIFKKGNKE